MTVKEKVLQRRHALLGAGGSGSVWWALSLAEAFDEGAVFGGDEADEDGPEAGDGGLAGFAVSGGHAGFEFGEQRGFEGGAGFCQAEEALAAVLGADALFDQALVLKFGEDAAEGLFGDGEEAEEIADRQSGTPGDEVERAVVGAAKAFSGEDFVGAADHGGVAEIEEFDAAADLVFAQEQRRGGCGNSGKPGGEAIWDSHVDISCTDA